MAITKEKRSRQNFARIPTIIDIPNLIEVQKKSFERFLQNTVAPKDRIEEGLHGVFQSIFPITNFSGTASLEYVGYEIGAWVCDCGEYPGLGGPGVVCERCGQEVTTRDEYEVDECRQRGMTYEAPLRVMVRLILSERDEEGGGLVPRDVKEQKVYLGEVPLMTDNGTFIINGTERVVVSQMHRSPGVFFSHDKGKSHSSGKLLYSARLIPYLGSWLDFEFDTRDLLHVRIDRRRKIPVTVLLQAFGLTREDILKTFYQREEVRLDRKRNVFFKEVSERLVGQRVSEDIVHPRSREVILRAGRKFSHNAVRHMLQVGMKTLELKDEELVGGILGAPVVDEATGEVLIEAQSPITPERLELLRKHRVERFDLLFVPGVGYDSTIQDTLAMDRCASPEEALVEIYKRLRPGDPPTKETAQNLFDNLFLSQRRYDLSRIGRLKLNTKLGLNLPLEQRTLTVDDVVATVRYLIELRHGIGFIDDIDHLGNRRVRSVGELLETQFRVGLVRMERAIRERMSIQELDSAMPHDLINSKTVTAAIKEFFGSSQLSQFMDQTNPLSEITHKRRLSALGPGGLTRERAGFEVRDVHPTHYGRICPIETPEGPNIGLIASLSTYARVNAFGFIEVPCRKVKNGRVTSEVEFLSAIDEDKYVIAQANAELDSRGYFTQELVSARTGGEFVMVSPEKVHYMDVSPKQLVSVATSLIPFLENDDANRALMGSNMQRQAVPLLRTEAPFVGTGMEEVAARDSGAVMLAREAGEVVSVDATRIVIRSDSGNGKGRAEPGVQIYSLGKYRRSNQNTCINQRPIVRVGQRVEKGEVIADGFATDQGELALGRNIMVAFMPWGGYNFEDAVVISEKVVKEDVFTSIHIEEFEVEARDTKQGREEITRDIPNVSEEALRNLDESGIIRIGAKVKPGDILVGRVTPKGETQLSPEEKLLRAIFGEKAGDVRDSSLTVPPGIEGTVVDVRVFNRRGADKDARTISIEEEEIARIVREERDKRIRSFLAGKTSAARVVHPKTGETLIPKKAKMTAEMVEQLKSKDLLKVQVEEEGLADLIAE
ncbi:MAG: DNA-directed RNA polymerase subunit beta, partial [Nitrospinota bacterium]